MESISTIDAWKKINASGVKLLTPVEVGKLWGIKNENTAYKMLQRWEKNDLLKRIAKGKYMVSDWNLNEFEIANLLLSSSYISFESALSFYGILPQFPYVITSATTAKSRKLEVDNKDFEFTHISPAMFWGYGQVNSALMAGPEKAMIDAAYLASKGLRKIDPGEWDLTGVNKKILRQYCRRVDYLPFKRLAVNQGWT
jgi:predicted transcriptional regulator of viral defense system